MTRIYLSYRARFNNVRDISTPSVIFEALYPEMKMIATLTDNILSDENMKVLPNGTISGVRVGYVDVDESLLSQFGRDIEYVKEELVNNGTIKIYLETPETLAIFLRNYTNLEEVESMYFKVRDEMDDPIMGKVEAKYIDLRS